ncbi:hypothetical protein HW932_20705 [Allochromatium humboldtianum]|uniref:PH domain-containing protein n=1 Tax=Allochromatium humboldtianum TaxID=504901 RepID=A0A850RLB6_9GAMM|nr:hypothetical protein [Allochromatium humboldtianum]NVZ11670.1 hypothetical protein [Allochromatium humboldtianum]
MGVEILPLSKGYGVRFPFALKEAFRVAFPSAKWNRDDRHWEVGVRSKKRLEAWIEAVKETAEALAIKEELDFVPEELEKIRFQLEAVEREIGTAQALRERLGESRALLEAARAPLIEAKARQEAQAAALIQEKADVNALLMSLIDLHAVKKAVDVMASNMVPADRGRKERFEAARAVVSLARDQLHEAGFALVAIDKIASANVNRPDRDHPYRHVLESDWYALRRVAAEDDDGDDGDDESRQAGGYWGVIEKLLRLSR